MTRSTEARIRFAARYAGRHLCLSAAIAVLGAILVLRVWYPAPHDLLSGGITLFVVLASVDVVCGPLLTLLLANPTKTRRALLVDMSLIAFIQIGALAYGMHAVYEARPLFLVHEVDRFRVTTLGDYEGAGVHEVFGSLDASMQPHWLKRPITVGIRPPKDEKERQTVLFASLTGGRDYAQRPDFYIPYDNAYRARVVARARPLSAFIARHPATAQEAARLLKQHGLATAEALFLPVVHKQDWVAVVDKSAHILGFLPGDGFGG